MSTSGLEVIRVVNREIQANTYIVPSGSGECLLIDPGLDRAFIESALSQSGLQPLSILCTHGHFDHVGSVEHFRQLYEVDVFLHDADRRVARSSNFTLMALKMPWRIETPTVTISLTEVASLTMGEVTVDVLHAPGHTPGSVVFLIDGHAFTGDTLYRRGIHLGSMPESDHDGLKASLQRLWDLLPADIEVHPGHGRPAVFAEIQRTNEPLRELLGLPVTLGSTS